MYKRDSIRRVMVRANQRRDELLKQKAKQIKICISDGNRKIGRVMNVSLMPIITCANCKECLFYCYDIKACIQYANTVIDARMRNTVLANLYRDKFFAEIDRRMNNRRKNKFFRWHVAGDIIDIDYFSRMVENARNHSDFVIWTYTKNYSVVNEYVRIHGIEAIPKNFHIMFSKWDGLRLENPYCFPVFACLLKAGNKDKDFDFDSAYVCPGNCDICKACNRGCIAGENTFAHEH